MLAIDTLVTILFLYLIFSGPPVTLSIWCMHALGLGPFATKDEHVRLIFVTDLSILSLEM